MSLEEIFDIEGKTVLLTGAAGYFGQYIARAFLSVGANLILLSRSNRLHVQAAEYRQSYRDRLVLSFQCDNYDRRMFRELLESVADQSRIDCLINNAYDASCRTGFNCPAGRLEKSSYEQWQRAFDCLYWYVLASQVVGGRMRQAGAGSIVNIASMYSLISPNPDLYETTGTLNPPTYSAHKAAVCAFTRYVAAFWGRYGVRCNAVLPGAFPNTESRGPNAVDKDGEFLKRLLDKERTALRRLGHPKELAGLLIFLACDASSYVTGQSIAIDGGWTIC